jgi:hypothetical protein
MVAYILANYLKGEISAFMKKHYIEEYSVQGCNDIHFRENPVFWRNITHLASGLKSKLSKGTAEVGG